MINKVTDTIYYIGVNDHDIDLFEGQYIVPEGMAYNSYMIKDEKIAVFDTTDKKMTGQWLANLEEALAGDRPSYLVVQHMEPDHSAAIAAFLEKYPDTTVVSSSKAFKIMEQFFPDFDIPDRMEVQEGSTLDLGSHKLNFVQAPMVHWPEVIMTYESTEKVLFSADAFGKFGALDSDEDWTCEARRYYIGIVGKYGRQVQDLLAKAAKLDIEKICSLHGPVLTENLSYYIDLYDTWSSYRAETEGVCIFYTSVYGNTKEAALLLADMLKEKGVEKVAVSDLARCDWAEAVEDAFRYDRAVFATTTYCGGIFPAMRQFIQHLTERSFRKRKVAFIQNGSWAPVATKIMKSMFERSEELDFAENEVTIRSALNEESIAQIEALAEEMAAGAKADSGRMKCSVCGFVYDPEKEGKPFDKQSDSYKCPICGMGKRVFVEEAAAKAAKQAAEVAAADSDKYICSVCGYVYDEAEAGKPFEEQPDSYRCPMCGLDKSAFKKG
ncbi:MAG: rubredoxin [Bacillota bacterium]|nr:rubredoxin [Bacillota bacterium]